MADAPDLDTYALTAAELPGIAAPDLPYQPPRPRSWRPRIALVGAGGISVAHLAAYREMGLDVVVIANRTLAKARPSATSSSPMPKPPTTSTGR
jgi:hypothetical protein